jgi:hypothetical protein
VLRSYLSALASSVISAQSGGWEGEHLARRGCSPPVFPLLFPSDVDRWDPNNYGALMQSVNRTRYQTAIKTAFRSAINSVGRTTSRVRSQCCQQHRQAGREQPEQGPGRAPGQNRGVAHAPDPLPTPTRDGGSAAQIATRIESDRHLQLAAAERLSYQAMASRPRLAPGLLARLWHSDSGDNPRCLSRPPRGVSSSERRADSTAKIKR